MSTKRLLGRAGDRRGVSNVLGLVLVVGMIVIATMVIVVVGATAFAQSESTVSMESAVTAMEKLNTDLMEVSSQDGGRASVAIPSMEGANLKVENTGWVNISVKYDKNGTLVENQTTGRIDLGKIVYRQGDQSVAIQGGGVWRTNRGGDSVAMIDRPSFQYRYGDGNPTLVFPVINLTGTSIDGGEVTVSQLSSPSDKLPSVNPLEPGTHLNVTVKSDYYLGWRGHFKSTTDGNVTLLGNEKVRLTLFGPEELMQGGNFDGALIAPFAGGHATNANLIDSYDSRVGKYSNSNQTHDDAYVALNGSRVIQMSRNVLVNGTMDIKTGFGPSDGVTVTHGVRVSEGGSVPNSAVFGGDSHFGGELMWAGWKIDGELRVGGKGNNVPQSVGMGSNTSDAAFLYRNGSITGPIYVNGSVLVKNSASYNGSKLVADGDIEITNGVVNANVTSTGDVFVTGGKINGTVRAKGNVTLKSGQINGDVYDSDGNLSGSGVSNHHGDNFTISPSYSVTVKEPKEPNIQNLDTSTSEIRENAGIGSSVSCSNGCTLDAGEYHSNNKIKLRSPSEEITFNTTGGNIELYVDGTFAIKSGAKVNVVGDGYVNIYIGGSGRDIAFTEWRSGQTRIGPTDQDATQLMIWARPDATLRMSGSPRFIGVIRGPGNATTKGMKLAVGGHSEIFGSIIGYPQSMSGNLQIHYDEALRSGRGTARVIAHGPTQVLYMQLSERQVAVN